MKYFYTQGLGWVGRCGVSRGSWGQAYVKRVLLCLYTHVLINVQLNLYKYKLYLCQSSVNKDMCISVLQRLVFVCNLILKKN
jgi:hypothetical protein